MILIIWTWMICSSGNCKPMPAPFYSSREICEKDLVKQIDNKETVVSPGFVIVCWPKE